MDNNLNKSKYMATGGLLTGVGIILVYLSGIVPVNKMYILAVASFIIPLSILTTNLKNTISLYISTSILSLLICGIKFTVIAYILFFGLYGLVKFYIERIRKLFIEIILKLAFFNICTITLLYIYKLFFPGLFNIKYNIYLVIIGLQIVFLIYDYLLTLIINFINRKLNK
ncbi:hypothetical protein J2Z42_001086 [Clostridium algifaecis]|uniref:DUF2232 domain-containing protein n=1 Tax=Clostridium algifaecis TaxID=1472040 RepID=A0ABS4KSQ2_9CLOT|nr:hypothetical protein [Clostridium algifaecis]MBP2032421.1 hypothetical protein [Clostridium algifaecis]